MPDAPGLELIRGEVEQLHPGAVLDTSFDRGQPSLVVDPAQILAVLGWLRDAPGQEYRFLSSLHVADYLPATPRFGVHYELLNRDRVERIRVKAMLADVAQRRGAGTSDAVAGRTVQGGQGGGASARDGGREAEQSRGDSLPEIDSCVHLFPTAEFQEREAFDFFGIEFRGHPDLTRILMPEDYVGYPQRRDFPIGGEPVTFTYNEHNYG